MHCPIQTVAHFTIYPEIVHPHPPDFFTQNSAKSVQKLARIWTFTCRNDKRQIPSGYSRKRESRSEGIKTTKMFLEISHSRLLRRILNYRT